jgi:apolipoprotein N-acyltransferase
MKDFSRTYLPALISGIALVFCFPFFDLYPLAWVALVPFLVSLRDMPRARVFRAGFVMGIPYFFGTHYWIYHSINHYGGVSLIPSIAVALLLSMYFCIYTGVFASVFSRKIKTSSLPALFLAPVIWVVLEYLRANLLTGFPGALIGNSQYKFQYIIQIADITGVYGVSFLVVAVNGMLADIFISRKRLNEMPLFEMSPTYIGTGLLIILLAVSTFYGHFRIKQDRAGNNIKVSIIQGNIMQDQKWDRKYQKNVIDIYKSLSLAARPGNPDLTVWPETAAPFYFGHHKDLTDELVDFQKTLGKHLLFGAITVKGDNNLSNSAILLNPDGRTGYVYDKIHLVPFGEYVPLKKLLFFVNKFAEGIGDYLPGTDYSRAETPFGEFGTHICYEIVFPELVRKSYKDGGDFIITITNDAWFGMTPGPYQHFSYAVLRAVENRKPVIRAANTGISGFIDSNGRILDKTALFEKAVLTREIKTDATLSIYTKYGDLLSYFCMVITVILLMNIRRK